MKELKSQSVSWSQHSFTPGTPSLWLDHELNIKWELLLYPLPKQPQHLAQRKVHVKVTGYSITVEWRNILNRSTEGIFYFGGHEMSPKGIRFHFPWFIWRQLETIEHLLIQLKMLPINCERFHGILQTRAPFYSQVSEHICSKEILLWKMWQQNSRGMNVLL